MRILLLTIRLFVGCVALQSMSSYATDVPGWYVGAAAGRSSSGLTQDDLTTLTGGWHTSLIDRSGSAYKLYGGHRLSPSFSIEGGYVDLGKVNFAPGEQQNGCSGPIPCAVPRSLNGVRKARNAQLSVVGTIPIGNQFSLFGQLGVTLQSRTEEHLQIVLGEVNPVVVKESSMVTVRRTTPAIGIGASYAFTPRISARLNWERFRNIGDSDKTGAHNMDLVSLGLEYYF